MPDVASRSAVRWMNGVATIVGAVVGLMAGVLPWGAIPALAYLPSFLALWALCVGVSVLLCVWAWLVKHRRITRALLIGSAMGLAAGSSLMFWGFSYGPGWSS